MTKKYRVGIVGVCHVHVHNVATIFKAHPQVELAAVADTVPEVPEISEAAYTRRWNLNYLVNDVGIPAVYDDWQAMLRTEKLDIVICNAENSQHPAVVRACAAAGTHVCVEKPMSMTLADGLDMVRASRQAGIAVVIHWYMPFSPVMRRVKTLVDTGAIGAVLEVRTRIGHAGPLALGVRHPGPNIETEPMTDAQRASTWWYQSATGGGAMLDFCSYGAVIARWLIGEPATAAAGMRANLNSQWSVADDNGAMLVRFPRAMGVFQGSWTTVDPGVTPTPIAYGTEGTIVIEEWTEKPAVIVARGGGQKDTHELQPPEQGRHDVAHALIQHIETGEPLHSILDPVFNLDAMAITEAGMKSAASGKMELVQNAAWEIGSAGGSHG